MNYHVSATRIEDIIKSVSALTQNTGSSDVKVNVNIFYQPVFNLDRNSQPETQKQVCVPNYQTLTPVLEASSPLIHDATESINSLDSPLKVKIEPCTAEVLDKAASLLSQEEKEVVSSDRSSFKLSNSQHSQKICVKALPKPISVNKTKDALLRKRKKIEQSCGCTSNTRPSLIPVSPALFEQQITKVKFFWRGTNTCYPFSFKKKIMKYYADTDEISVDNVIDYSQKIIVNEEGAFY